MPFHRLDDPTYHLMGGAFPGVIGGETYTRINVNPGGVGAGAAPMDPASKVGGPNVGTDMVAFGEDGRSEFANRPHRALAENTDYLDDIIHRSLAMPVRTADVLAGAPVASVVIAGDVFVGQFGTPNNQTERNRLISVLDDDDNEIIDATGATVEASLIHDGFAANVLGTMVDGFYTGPTVDFVPSIPTGVTYRIYYGERGNLSELPINAFTEIKIRAAEEVDGGVQRVLSLLHDATTGGQAWDDPWNASIEALAASGLNERYRRQTTVPGSFTFDTAGDGAVITRDGEAVTSQHSASSFADKIDAQFRADPDPATLANATGPTNPQDAGYGHVHYHAHVHGKSVTDGSEPNERGLQHSGASLLFQWPHDLTGVLVGGGDLKTQVRQTASATLNPGGAGATVVELNVTDFFHDGSIASVACGYDMLEITRPIGGDVETYVITELVTADPRRCLVRKLGGDPPVFAVDESVNVRLVSTLMHHGNGAAEIYNSVVGATDPVRLRMSMTHATPIAIDQDFSHESPGFYGYNFLTQHALVWGDFSRIVTGLNPQPTYEDLGFLHADGTAEPSRLLVRYVEYKQDSRSVVAGANAISHNLGIHTEITGDGAFLGYTLVGVPTSVTISLSAAGGITSGRRFFIVIENGAFTNVAAWTWPAQFIFSGTDALVATGVGEVTKYEGIARGGNIYFTRTQY